MALGASIVGSVSICDVENHLIEGNIVFVIRVSSPRRRSAWGLIIVGTPNRGRARLLLLPIIFVTGSGRRPTVVDVWGMSWMGAVINSGAFWPNVGRPSRVIWMNGLRAVRGRGMAGIGGMGVGMTVDIWVWMVEDWGKTDAVDGRL